MAIGPSSAQRSPGPFGHGAVEVGHRDRAAPDEVVRLAPQRRLQPVDDVARAARRAPAPGCGPSAASWPPSSPATVSSDVALPPTTSTSGIEVRRVERVRDHDPLGVAAGVLERAGPEAGRAAGQHDVRRGRLVERGEQRALDVEAFGPGLDHQVGGGRGRGRDRCAPSTGRARCGVGVEIGEMGRRPPPAAGRSAPGRGSAACTVSPCASASAAQLAPMDPAPTTATVSGALLTGRPPRVPGQLDERFQRRRVGERVAAGHGRRPACPAGSASPAARASCR